MGNCLPEPMETLTVRICFEGGRMHSMVLVKSSGLWSLNGRTEH